MVILCRECNCPFDDDIDPGCPNPICIKNPCLTESRKLGLTIEYVARMIVREERKKIREIRYRETI